MTEANFAKCFMEQGWEVHVLRELKAFKVFFFFLFFFLNFILFLNFT